MFVTLLIKEIHETLINLRFMVAALLCIILIPLGFWVTMQEYGRRAENYSTVRQLYADRAEGKLNFQFEAEGYRPPSPLVMLSTGLEYNLPNKVITSNGGRITIYNDSGLDNPLSLLLGKIDFQFIVSMILSLMALMFMFDSISGEKEQGTLRLIIANQLPRWKLITAKIAGSALVFFMPFAIALLIVLLMVNLSGSISLADGVVLPGLLTGFGVSVLFLVAMFCLGALVSVMVGRSITSLIILLVLWTMFVLVIPKLSPMIAEIIHPITSQQVWAIERHNAEEALITERDNRLKELYERIRNDLSPMQDGVWERETQDMVMATYDEEKIPIENEYAERIATTVRGIDTGYTNERRAQLTIARNISRLSPVSCFQFILSEIAGTGLMEVDNWQQAAEQFQDQVTQDVYDKFDVRVYAGFSGSSTYSDVVDGFDPETAPVPQMNDYRPVHVVDALGMVWPDLLLLALYTVLFFAGAFVKFIRYDVR